MPRRIQRTDTGEGLEKGTFGYYVATGIGVLINSTVSLVFTIIMVVVVLAIPIAVLAALGFAIFLLIPVWPSMYMSPAATVAFIIIVFLYESKNWKKKK